MKNTVLVLWILLVAIAIAPSVVQADMASDEATIRAMVHEVWKKVAVKKYDGTDLNPRGAWQATSQGGLWKFTDREEQETLLNQSPNTLHVAPSHVEVAFLGARKEAAFVAFYLTGTIKLPDGNTIPDYRTRASWVLEKLEGNWVVSGAHYSPLFGGSGVRFD